MVAFAELRAEVGLWSSCDKNSTRTQHHSEMRSRWGPRGCFQRAKHPEETVLVQYDKMLKDHLVPKLLGHKAVLSSGCNNETLYANKILCECLVSIKTTKVSAPLRQEQPTPPVLRGRHTVALEAPQ